VGVPYDEVEVNAADTSEVPDSGPTVASRTCMVVGKILQRAAEDMRGQLGRLTLEPGLRLGFYDSSVPNPASRSYSNHSISPRVGAAWDLSPDHRTVLRGHYGHYHDPMSTRFYEYLDPTADSPLVVARVLGPGQFEEITRVGGPTNIPTIDPEIKHSYAEEWFGGIEREVWPRVSVKAQYIRRNVRDAIGFTDTGSVWIPASVIDPGPDGVLQTADDGRELTIYYRDGASASSILMTNPPGAWRHFDGIQLVGTRRFADGWSLQASYSWGRTVGSFDNSALNHAGEVEAEIVASKPELRGAAHGVIELGGAKQRLGRDASPIEADAAEMLALDDRRLEPELGRADRRHIASGSGADHGKIELALSALHAHHRPLSAEPPRRFINRTQSPS